MTEETNAMIIQSVKMAIGQRFGQVVVKVTDGEVSDIEVTTKVPRDLIKAANAGK